MGAITQGAIEPAALPAQSLASADQRIQQQAAEQSAQGDKNQRVGELAMVLQEQQRVGAGADQYVEIGGHAGQKPE